MRVTEHEKCYYGIAIFYRRFCVGCKRGLLLNDLETWNKYRKLRNLTSHNYDEFNFESILAIIPIFIEEIDYNRNFLPEKIKIHISSLLENSLLPYTVDIIDINAVSPVFKAKIEKDFVRLAVEEGIQLK